MKLSSVLKQLLKQKGMSISDLGKAVGVPPKTIYSWVNSGQSPRNIDQVKAIADFFSLSLNELLYAEVPKPKDFEDYREEIQAGTFDVILRRVKNK